MSVRFHGDLIGLYTEFYNVSQDLIIFDLAQDDRNAAALDLVEKICIEKTEVK